MLARFAAWRYAAAMSAFHEHLEDCRLCEFDLPCPRIERIISRRAYWLARIQKVPA